MKFGRPISELREWHRWFAWHPVSIEDGRIVWLEVVERRIWLNMMYSRMAEYRSA
jgi:hypothetical protein